MPPPDPVPLEIVETGFTAFADDTGGLASYGVVLRNPNETWTAFRMEILLDFLDADGAFVAGDEVPVTLLPGQTSALAGEVFGAGRAVRLEVRLPDDITAFVAGSATDDTFEILDVATIRRDDLNVTTGRLVSLFDQAQRQVSLFALYRDGGEIVGGAAGATERIEPGAEVPFEIIDSAPFKAIEETDVHWQLSGIGQ